MTNREHQNHLYTYSKLTDSKDEYIIMLSKSELKELLNLFETADKGVIGGEYAIGNLTIKIIEE